MYCTHNQSEMEDFFNLMLHTSTGLVSPQSSEQIKCAVKLKSVTMSDSKSEEKHCEVNITNTHEQHTVEESTALQHTLHTTTT